MLTRRMPVEENWFDKKTNDLLYGYLQASASYNKDEQDTMKRLYYPKAQFNKELKIIKQLIGCSDKRTVTTKIKTLMERGYLAEDANNYYFPYNPDNFYIILDRDLLFYICTTMSQFSLKTYVYLADKARMKDNYHFTIKELRVAFGYSSNSQNATMEKAIGGCLDVLARTGLIRYHKEYVDVNYNESGYKCPNFVLDYVATTLPTETEAAMAEMADDCKAVDAAVSDYMAEQKPVNEYFVF